MQLTGDRFTNATAILGNDLATLPDFPAEIRAPAGTLAGVSAFQIHFASRDIVTPGDAPNVLVAMNPAALKANIRDLEKGGTLIVNEDAFIDRNLEKAGYASNPLEDGTLDGYQVYRVPMTSITVRATEGVDITKKEAERAKNMFALGLLSWMYSRPTEVTLRWLEKKFAAKQTILDANLAAFKAGYNFGETTELFAHHYEVKKAPAEPGVYRNVSGNTAMFGRHGESPIPIVASYTPANCFDVALEAVRIAVKYRTPVILLSDTFLTNSSEPWRLPDVDRLPTIDPHFATQVNHDDGFMPYLRDDNLARPWALPGTPGLEHRVGGLEKEDVSGNISYDGANHERMTHLRAAKVQKIADDIPPLPVDDPDSDATLLVLGWGSSYGAIIAGARRARDRGLKVATAHLTHLNPLPSNIEEVLRRYPRVLLPEMNLGQLAMILRARFLIDVESFTKVQGQPIHAHEIEDEILRRLG